jgi:hypothetical protein
MRELDLNFVFFPGFAGPGAALGAARCGAKAGSGPKNVLFALKPRIHASPKFSPFLPHARARSEFCFFSLDLRPLGAKAGSGTKNGLFDLKLRIHASPSWSPALPYAQTRCHFCFGFWGSWMYSRVQPCTSIPLRPPQTPRRPCEFESIESTVEPITKALSAKLLDI